MSLKITLLFRLFWVLLLVIAGGNMQASVVILNGLAHIHKVMPGEVYTGQIEMQNQEDIPQTVEVYQRDYHFIHTGESFFEEPENRPRSNTGWIKISPAYLIFQPKEKKVVRYKIRVPESEALIGTYWSVIMIEGIEPVKEDAIQRGLQIKSLVRYAVQIATHIGETGKRDLNFLNVELKAEKGNRFLQVDVENTGERLLSPVVSLELFDALGQSAALVITTRKKTYPGTSLRYILNLDGIKPDNYQALLLADCGDEDVFGMNLTLDLTNE